MPLGAQKLRSPSYGTGSLPPTFEAGGAYFAPDLGIKFQLPNLNPGAGAIGSFNSQDNPYSIGSVPIIRNQVGNTNIASSLVVTHPWTISFWFRCSEPRRGTVFSMGSGWEGNTNITFPSNDNFTISAGSDGIEITTGRAWDIVSNFNLNEFVDGWHHIYIVYDYRRDYESNLQIKVDGRDRDFTATPSAYNPHQHGYYDWAYFGREGRWNKNQNNNTYTFQTLNGGSQGFDIAQFGIWGSPGSPSGQPIPINYFYPNINLGKYGNISGISFTKPGSPYGGSGQAGGWPALYAEFNSNSDRLGLTSVSGYALFAMNQNPSEDEGPGDPIVSSGQWNPDATVSETYFFTKNGGDDNFIVNGIVLLYDSDSGASSITPSS